jgi:hypothetical protein
LVFSGLQWYAADRKEISRRIEAAAPYLLSVNITGVSTGGQYEGCRVEPLDRGEMDNFALLALLGRYRYDGYIGFNGYTAGGDPYRYLDRSLKALREMEERLERHPSWSAVDFSRVSY